MMNNEKLWNPLRRMNQNKTRPKALAPHLPFNSSPNGDTIIIHYSFFIIHLLF